MNRASLSYADRAQLNEIGCVRPRNDDREKALVDLRAKLVAVQQEVLTVHRSVANLCDVQDYLQYALDALESEVES